MKTKAEVELALLKARLAYAREQDCGGERESAWVDVLTWVLGKESDRPVHAWDERFIPTLDRAIGDFSAAEEQSQKDYQAKHKTRCEP